jgi:[ribosomal protein S5]-alanine N-acetyltransferase
MNFSPFPRMNGNRVLLRRLSESDKEAIFFLRTDEVVNEFLYRKKPANLEEAIQFINSIEVRINEGQSIFWAISLKNEPELIGTICLWNFSADNKVAELGYEMNPLFHKRGLMTEAINCVIDYGFKSLKLNAIEAFTNKNNLRSIRLLQRIGFVLLPERVDEDFPLNLIFKIVNPNEKSPASL